MLARTPFTEIEIDGVGIYRLPNQWQGQRLRRLRGEERHTAVLPIGCGMTVRRFNKLPAEKQQEVHRAYLALMSRAMSCRWQNRRRPTLEQCPAATYPSTRRSLSAAGCSSSRHGCRMAISGHGLRRRRAYPEVWPRNACVCPREGARTRGKNWRRRTAGRGKRALATDVMATAAYSST